MDFAFPTNNYIKIVAFPKSTNNMHGIMPVHQSHIEIRAKFPFNLRAKIAKLTRLSPALVMLTCKGQYSTPTFKTHEIDREV
jgi:DNA-binding LytR/AlgR family response regulator